MKIPNIDYGSVLDRAAMLGDHAVLHNLETKNRLGRRAVKYENIDQDKFLHELSTVNPNVERENINDSAINFSNALYSCAVKSKVTAQERENVDLTVGRWERLILSNNDEQIWKAIDWKGEYQQRKNGDIGPEDNEFKEMFENMFNPSGEHNLVDEEYVTNIRIPLLDDPIQPREVVEQVKKMKIDKSCGPDGVPPGILKLLPIQWILFITTFLNNLFPSRLYPESWSIAKMVTIFKRGNRNLACNYRGISIINSLAKLYDMVLCCRLQQWFVPHREQAGAQPKRGCLEHIVALRMLTDTAKRKKKKLFVTFVDFSQAYDRVSRHKLFSLMKNMGCGMVMLGALVAMYRTTQSIIGTAVITATVGVRQGSPTSCFLFILYVNEMIRIIKENSMNDGFLTWLHVLVMMDDTVILSTTREAMLHKVSLLQRFCSIYGMKINQSKTKFFVINGTVQESQPLQVDNLTIDNCTKYVYLGSPFTSDGCTSSSIKEHANTKMCHVLKFVSFLKKNNDVPYTIKKRIFDAAFVSTILYGCESWFNADMSPITKLYNWALKELLGVRLSTCNDLCYIESGCPPVKDLIKSKQRKFFKQMWNERSGYVDDPLAHAMSITIRSNSPTGKYINNLINNDIDDIDEIMQKLRENISNSNSSRRAFYKMANPELKLAPVYNDKKELVLESHRMAFTRFRLSAHSLAIETGRWNRRGRGRLPIEERLCACGRVQSEAHVVEECPRTEQIREEYGFRTINDLFSKHDYKVICKIIFNVLYIYM